MPKKVLYCPNCSRSLPNDKFLINGKCVWCDSEYHLRKCLKDKEGKVIDRAKGCV